MTLYNMIWGATGDIEQIKLQVAYDLSDCVGKCLGMFVFVLMARFDIHPTSFPSRQCYIMFDRLRTIARRVIKVCVHVVTIFFIGEEDQWGETGRQTGTH